VQSVYAPPKTGSSLTATTKLVAKETKKVEEAGRGRMEAMETIPMACIAVNSSFSVSDHFKSWTEERCGKEVDLLTSQWQWRDYHVITDRNNLRKIFRWVCGEDERWRIDIEKVSLTTLAMLRFDLEDDAEQKQHKIVSNTSEGLCSSGEAAHESYRAIVDVDVAGIRFLIRCYVKASSEDALEGAFSGLSLSSCIKKLEGSELCYYNSELPLSPRFVEPKPFMKSRFAKIVQEKSFLLDVWFQCFLVGVHKLVFCLKAKGRCTGDLTVVDIKEFDPDSLISFCERAGLSSFRTEAEAKLRQTIDVVQWMKRRLADEPIGSKFSLLFEPTDEQPPRTIKLYQRPASALPCFPAYVYEDKPLCIVSANSEVC